MPAPVLIASNSLFSKPHKSSPFPSKTFWANLRAKEKHLQLSQINYRNQTLLLFTST